MNAFVKRTPAIAIALGLAWSTLLIGCWDKPATPPRTDDWRQVTLLSVEKTNPEEVTAVTNMETARANYRYRLEVLAGYYNKIGHLDKYNWAMAEWGNLNNAKVFTWENVPEVQPPTGESLSNADERLLVEFAVAARNEYIDSVNKVLKMYEARRQDFKAKTIANMRDRLDPIKLYPYFPDAMLPPRDLKPVEVISEAEAMYAQAVGLFKEGKGWAHTFVSTSYEKERQAAVLFQKLIHDYPRSTRIAMSAYYLAEINKEYFRQNTLAVFWYERAWTWDPNIPEPARFQAATVYDVHLHNYAKAVECYRKSMQSDPGRLGNYEFSKNRVAELTGTK